MTEWLSSGGWGTREQAIPGEWALLVLIIVSAAVLGFLVLWFTMLRHERTVLHRARATGMPDDGLVGGGEAAEAVAQAEPETAPQQVAEMTSAQESEPEARR